MHQMRQTRHPPLAICAGILIMKTIVTHIGPDLDAITSVWLVKTFFPSWEEASVAFVPAGKTLNNASPDADPHIIHVDTGFGRFDHHQTNADTCASRLLYEEITKTRGSLPALERLVLQVNEIDHFKEVYYPDPTSDIWLMSVVTVIDGWRLIHSEDQLKIISLGFDLLDGLYKTFQNRVWAEAEIKDKGSNFQVKWGKALAIETTNDEVGHLAQKMGYTLVIRRDPKKGYLKIRTLPKPEIDLTTLYDRLKTDEPEATWFLHASRHMLLNGSTKNPDMKPSKRSLSEIVEVIKEVCV